MLEHVPGDGHVPRVKDVLEPELHRVHPQRLGQPVHLHLGGEGCLGIAETAKGGAVWIVGDDAVRVHFDVGDLVGPAGKGRRAEEHRVGGGGIRAAVAINLHFGGDQPPVAGSAGAVAQMFRVPLARSEEGFSPRPDELHRAPGLHRAQRSDDLNGDVLFPPEPPAHRHVDHADFLKRQVECGGDVLLIVDRALAAHVYRYPPQPPRSGGEFHPGYSQAGLGFQVGVFDGRGEILTLNNHIRLGEPLLNVALTNRDVTKQIPVLVNCWRSLGKRLLGIFDHRQRLVFNPDEGQRRLGLSLALRVHSGHDLAQVTHAVLGKDRLILADDAKTVPAGYVSGREHRRHARRTFGGRGVHAQQAGVGIRGTEHFGVEHALYVEVGGVLEPSGDLVHAVHPRHAPPDDLVFSRAEFAGRHLLHAVAEQTGRLLNGDDDGPVARATAQVMLEGFLDLLY